MMSGQPTITVASYNMRRAIGTDRKRNPQRVLQVLEEIGADIVALQEADKRVGTRGAAMPHAMIDDHGHYRAIDFNISHPKLLDRLPDGFIARMPDHPLTAPLKRLDFKNLGWHGNAILVKQDVAVTDLETLDLPTIEPRGAVMAELCVRGTELRVIGMHLDISGLRRRQQIVRILGHIEARHRVMPTIIMGDTNEWRARSPGLREFDGRFVIADCGPSFHSRKPVAPLDRIIVDRRFTIAEAGVHMSDAARTASDHLPVWARLTV